MKDKEIKEILDNPKILMLSYGNYISLDDYCKLKDYITKLEEENKDYKSRCFEARKMIFDNYGVLDKYGIEMLDDILQGDNKE